MSPGELANRLKQRLGDMRIKLLSELENGVEPQVYLKHVEKLRTIRDVISLIDAELAAMKAGN